MGRDGREGVGGTHQETSERGGFARGGRFESVVVVVGDARRRLARRGGRAPAEEPMGEGGDGGRLRGARVRIRNAGEGGAPASPPTLARRGT